MCVELGAPAVCERPAIAEAAPQEEPTDPSPPVLEADDLTDDLDLEEEIEIVEELAFEEAVDESPPLPQEAPMADAGEQESTARDEDPFVTLARVLEQVARGAGAEEGALATLRVVIGQARVGADTTDDVQRMRTQALAWQGILRGESEDFGACGASALDEWSAQMLATILGNPGKADGLRRELRRRGVAAFGIVADAA